MTHFSIIKNFQQTGHWAKVAHMVSADIDDASYYDQYILIMDS